MREYKYMKFLGIPSCKDIFTQRYARVDLPFLKKMTLKMHMSICKNCQGFQQTMGILEKRIAENLSKKASSAKPEKITEIIAKANESLRRYRY